MLHHQHLVAALFRSTSLSTHEFNDDEFGVIKLRRNARAKYVRLRMSPDGELSVTLPTYATSRHAKELLDRSRPAVRKWLSKISVKKNKYSHGDQLGHSHNVVFSTTHAEKVSVHTNGLTITVKLPANMESDDPVVQVALQPAITKALQKEARAYLPRRLRFLANQFGFSYSQTRFGAPKGRWGSCSSKGTISLNIGLMELEDSLIDYVLVHELCHTRQMNHSPDFWKLVEDCLPDYKLRRRSLKKIRPF